MQQLGAERGLPRSIYRKPHPNWIDNIPYSRGFKMPDFAVFTGEEDQSTVEHVGRFLAQCGEAGTNEYLRLRLFPLSLSRITFTWYTNLPANSIQTWAEMKKQFHLQFYQTVADLARMYQYNTEIVDQFIARFKKSKNRYLTSLTEKEFTNLAFNGLRFNIKERFEEQAFDDLF